MHSKIGLFQSSTIPTYQKINAFMEGAKPNVYADSNKDGKSEV